ncbi:DUF7220 family protein [Roseovarius amoyensis]|uniref:DUF7220 family protein n=1 Tax=Roseovarius amoyensis TaxID=2211448 RepID=UPI003B838C13
MSLIEAVTNVAVGYGLAVTIQIIVFPWFGLHPSLGENLVIGTLFTAFRCCAATRCAGCSSVCDDRGDQAASSLYTVPR